MSAIATDSAETRVARPVRRSVLSNPSFRRLWAMGGFAQETSVIQQVGIMEDILRGIQRRKEWRIWIEKGSRPNLAALFRCRPMVEVCHTDLRWV